MKRYVFSVILVLCSFLSHAQDEDVFSYKRNSLYPILITFPSDQYSIEINTEYDKLGISAKYNDHRLSILKLTSDKKNIDSDDIEEFLDKNNVARRMVARWFNRDKASGVFDTFLISERGNYDANLIDVSEVSIQKRGNVALSDAGEQLIGNTFVIVNKISYVDKEKVAGIVSAVFQILGGVAGVVSQSSSGYSGNTSAIADVTKSAAQLGSTISDMIAGFTVKTTSHLYQLVWNDEIADIFYTRYWCDANTPKDSVAVRKARFDNERDLFRLQYIGSYQAKSQKTVLRGVYDNSDVIRKVCARALDKNVAELQRRYEIFRVKVPVVSVSDDGKTISAPIGMKEGVDMNTKYEVLEVSQDESGRTTYKRKGMVRPVRDKIWDNRYMAVEEEATGADLKGTTFEVISGNGLYKGMLLREWSERSSAVSKPTMSTITASSDSQNKVLNNNPEQQTKRIKEEKRPKEKKVPSADGNQGRTLIMAVVGVDANNINNFTAERLSFGLQFGWARKMGLYGKFKTNFVFDKPESTIDPDYGWTNGNSKVSYMTATAGLMIRVIPQLYINVGGGYGVRTLMWESLDNRWCKVYGKEKKGAVVEASLLGRFNKFSVSLGCNALVGEGVHLEPEVGVGIMF